MSILTVVSFVNPLSKLFIQNIKWAFELFSEFIYIGGHKHSMNVIFQDNSSLAFQKKTKVDLGLSAPCR